MEMWFWVLCWFFCIITVVVNGLSSSSSAVNVSFAPKQHIKNDPREDECEVVSWCSTARFFLLSLSFLFSFHPLLEIGKNTPIPSTVIFFVETDVVWNKGETSISTPVLALFPSLIWTWITILITEELPTSNSCGIATVAAMFLLLY